MVRSFINFFEPVAAQGIHGITFCYFLLVADSPHNNDMVGDEEDSWKTAFEGAGYEVECVIKGLGELEAIQQLFVQHAQAAVDSLAK